MCFAFFSGLISGASGAFEDGLAAVVSTAHAEEDGGRTGEEEEEFHVVDPTRQGDGYSTVLYNNENGLPTSEANDIVQTSEGFLWIGSYSGLIRYDGNTFERMDSRNGVASVVDLFVDSKNRLWIGTNDGGVAVRDKGQTRIFGLDDGLKSLSIRGITEDDAGNIYVATTRGVAEINEAMVVRTLEQPDIRDEYMRSIEKGPDGIIYCLTQNGDLFTIVDGSRSRWYDLPAHGLKDVVSLYPDPEQPGCLFLGTENSTIYHVDTNGALEDYTTIDAAPLKYINSVMLFSDHLWICADNGIGVYKNDKFEVVENIPLDNSIDHVLIDYQGNLWFTSSRQGVMKIVPNRFTDISAWYDLDHSVVNATCAYEDKLMIGTDNGLVLLDNDDVIPNWTINSARTASDKMLDVRDLIEMMKGVRIRSIFCDSKKRVWFCTYSDYGLVRYDHGRIVCFTQADGIPSERVRMVYECRDGRILAACTGGLAVIRGNTVIDIYNDEDGLKNTEILTATEAANGDILIGTDGGGFYAVRESGEILRFDTRSGLMSDVVMRIKRARNNNDFWLVTSNSLAYMDEQYNITTIRNFPYSNNFDMYENSKGEMWILSSNGIYVTTVEALRANGEIDYTFYNRYNGLPHVTTANSFSELTADGKLYIAGSTGVSRVNIDEDFERIDDLKMAVPFITADGVDIYPDDDGNFTISSDVNKIVIYGCVYTYSLSNPLITYRLDGFDTSDTVRARTEFSTASYTNLKGKTYRFTMSINDSKGQKGSELIVKIVKEKKLTEMWWFQLILILAGAALVCWLVVLYVRAKMNKLIAKEKEQKTFIHEMTEAFARTIDMKDRYTNGHSTRVAQYTSLLAEELGCDEDTIEKYRYIALLHDIGKIGVPAAVLNKAGQLDDEEFKIIKSHATLGYRALKDISIMPELATGAEFHHERPDGKGYPKGLKGDEIPRVAQIIAVADTFDAMYSDRPYRKRMNFDKVVDIIRNGAGTQLAADVVEAFLKLVEKGHFRAPDDNGGGTTDDIDNIHKSFTRAQAVKEAAAEAIREKDAAERKDADAEEKVAAEQKDAENAEKKNEANGPSDDVSADNSDGK
ncbi:MAG: HD domain-containing protein [Lachnospiraceae bacterium]|nr:HD domain-containing protein [Lachnospiraceae bacterium]